MLVYRFPTRYGPLLLQPVAALWPGVCKYASECLGMHGGHLHALRDQYGVNIAITLRVRGEAAADETNCTRFRRNTPRRAASRGQITANSISETSTGPIVDRPTVISQILKR